jgi:NAD(P)-dependent dehydrogenase (short-subunit alcohol dehydrogenase family)
VSRRRHVRQSGCVFHWNFLQHQWRTLSTSHVLCFGSPSNKAGRASITTEVREVSFAIKDYKVNTSRSTTKLPFAMISSSVVVVIGCGDMGIPVACRLGVGRHLVLADFSDAILSTAEATLTDEGYLIHTHKVDISDFVSVNKLAEAASAVGAIDCIVVTAGISPSAGSVRRVYEVNLVGTANVIDAFLPFAQAGTSLVCISSMAGYLIPPLSAELEKHIATAPREELLNHAEFKLNSEDPKATAMAYPVSKRGNILQVQAAAVAWGKKGARVNSVSPGVISTANGRKEIAGPAGKFVQMSPAGRVGTPQDIVNAVAFLASIESSFVTGVDLLIDGGVVSSQKWKK